MQPVVAGIYKLEIPLPGSPLKSVNSYVIPAGDRFLVVDTGMNRPECRDALLAGFAELHLDPANADFFITHFHMDHLGLAPALASAGAEIIISQTDAATVEDMRNPANFAEQLKTVARPSGLSDAEEEYVLRSHPGVKYRPDSYPVLRKMHDGDTLPWGEFTFTCIETPGHTPGHMCLYEPTRRLFLAGDHILGDITPNISAMYGSGSPLDDYLKSLDKVRHLPVDIVLPGHRAPFHNMAERIRQLEQHHEARAQETLESLGGQSLTAYQVAARLTWSISIKGWENFPIMQKWFATGEAAAHLKYLVGRGLVSCDTVDDLDLYSRGPKSANQAIGVPRKAGESHD